MQQWRVNLWETYALVVNWIGVRYFLVIESLHKFSGMPIYFVLAFTQVELYIYL